jgi:tetratricopeptide (TPR) repeat protein
MSYHYYSRFLALKEAYQLDIYRPEDAKIGMVYEKMGYTEEAEALFSKFKIYADNDRSIYKHLSLASYYAYQGDKQQAMKHLKKFSREEHYHYWTVLFADIDPVFEDMQDLPEFKAVWREIDAKFWDWHEQIRETLLEKNLI